MFCEHCGTGPECAVCGRGVGDQFDHSRRPVGKQRWISGMTDAEIDEAWDAHLASVAEPSAS